MNNIVFKSLVVVKRRKKLFIFITVLVVGVLFWFFKFFGNDDSNDYTVAKIGSVIQEVSITGRVKSAQSVDLSFERSGRVIYVGVKSGDMVSAGRLLIRLDDSELLAQEQIEKANLAVAEARLDQVLASSNKGGDASTVADLLSGALRASIDAMIDFTDVQYKHFNGNTGPAIRLAQEKEQVLQMIYGQAGFGRAGAWYFTAFNSGLKLKVDEFQRNPGSVSGDPLLLAVKDVLFKTKSAMELMQSELAGEVNASPTDADKVRFSIDKILTQITQVSSQKKSSVDESYDVEIAKSQLEQAKASLALVQAQISKFRLTAPFPGIVANIDVKTGQTIMANEKIVSLIGDAKYQIEANISEADIAKISLNDPARITLDAYGDNFFEAKVVHIDPAGRIIDGITVYKVTLEFDKNDERILSGLTADADILTDEKSNILYIPSREVVYRDGKKYVRVVVDEVLDNKRFANLTAVSKNGGQYIFEVEVITGLKGSDGKIEVISGLKEGDKIVRE